MACEKTHDGQTEKTVEMAAAMVVDGKKSRPKRLVPDM
jgi:hypothetical protein